MRLKNEVKERAALLIETAERTIIAKEAMRGKGAVPPIGRSQIAPAADKAKLAR